MKLIVFTPENIFDYESNIINKLFELELETLHLRKPNLNLYDYRAIIQNISTDFHKRIVIHNHFELANEFEIKGIHLKKSNINNLLYFKDINFNLISYSCHNLNEILEQKQNFQYLFLSPIFDSISKENYPSKISGNELFLFKNANIIDEKIIALGGINEHNIEKIYSLGFGGAAILGAIWKKNECEILKTFKRIKNECDRY